jgi:hypothetical protein
VEKMAIVEIEEISSILEFHLGLQVREAKKGSGVQNAPLP